MLAAWAGPGFEAFGKAGLLVLYLPAMLLASGVWMGLGARGRGAAPLVAVSLAFIAVAINAGVWLGGSDEVVSC